MRWAKQYPSGRRIEAFKTLRSHHLAPPNSGIKMRFIRRREKAGDRHVACYRTRDELNKNVVD